MTVIDIPDQEIPLSNEEIEREMAAPDVSLDNVKNSMQNAIPPDFRAANCTSDQSCGDNGYCAFGICVEPQFMRHRPPKLCYKVSYEIAIEREFPICIRTEIRRQRK